jgi:GH15 family glucan-1,4-alpha-glucosidase
VLKVTRRYVAASLVLETTMHTASGVIELTDCLAWGESPARLMRHVRCVSGRVALTSELSIRLDHGRTRAWLRAFDRRIAAIGGSRALWFDAPSAPECDAGVVRNRIELSAGEMRGFVLTCCRSYDPPPATVDVYASLDVTLQRWAHWTARLDPLGERYAEPIRRSLAVLKGLTNRLTGGIAAAATSSLPERIGGDLNWDYRYCWLRDASFTMLALAGTGLRPEAQAWRDWLLRVLAGDPEHAQPIYTTEGDAHIAEWECPWLSGYESSRPVRFGNAAVKQSQYDIFDEIIDALFVSRCHDMPPDDDIWLLERHLIEHVRRIWMQPDNGLWESRGKPVHHTLSKVMAWLALDRGVTSATRFGRDAPIDDWRRDAEAIRQSVLTHGFHRDVNAFTQAYDSDRLDASLLLLPLRGFLPADDPRIVATVDAIERHLMRDGLVFRFLDARGARREGAFIACRSRG